MKYNIFLDDVRRARKFGQRTKTDSIMSVRKPRAQAFSPKEIEEQRRRKDERLMQHNAINIATCIVDRGGMLDKIGIKIRDVGVSGENLDLLLTVKLLSPSTPTTYVNGITIIPTLIKRCIGKRMSNNTLAAALNHVLKCTKFTGYTVDCGRFRIDFNQMNTTVLGAFIKLLKTTKTFNSCSWLAPLIDLKISKELAVEEKPKKKKNFIKSDELEDEHLIRELREKKPYRPFASTRPAVSAPEPPYPAATMSNIVATVQDVLRGDVVVERPSF